MAIVSGKAGQFSKIEADKRMLRFVMVAVFSGFALGVCSGFSVAWRNSLMWWAIAMAGMFCSYYVFKWWLDKPLRSLTLQRLKYLRGARAEALVAWLLLDLSDEWHVFHGIQLRDRQDVDHVVVGPSGVWCISTKSHRGLFSEQSDGRVFHNNKPTSFIGEATGFAKELKQRLAGLLGADVPWVEAVLAVPLAFVEFAGQRNGVWVLHQDDLTDTFERQQKRLSPKDVKRVADAIGMIAAQAKAVWRDPAKNS